MSKKYSKISAKIISLPRLNKKLARLGSNAKSAFKSALYKEAEGIMTESKKIVPVLWGILKGSGRVLPPEESGDRISVTLGYGGAASDYALEVHENMKSHHNVGKAKYLEIPFVEAQGGMARRIADMLDDKLL